MLRDGSRSRLPSASRHQASMKSATPQAMSRFHSTAEVEQAMRLPRMADHHGPAGVIINWQAPRRPEEMSSQRQQRPQRPSSASAVTPAWWSDRLDFRHLDVAGKNLLAEEFKLSPRHVHLVPGGDIQASWRLFTQSSTFFSGLSIQPAPALSAEEAKCRGSLALAGLSSGAASIHHPAKPRSPSTESASRMQQNDLPGQPRTLPTVSLPLETGPPRVLMPATAPDLFAGGAANMVFIKPAGKSQLHIFSGAGLEKGFALTGTAALSQSEGNLREKDAGAGTRRRSSSRERGLAMPAPDPVRSRKQIGQKQKTKFCITGSPAA